MKALITGGAGFIGSTLAGYLASCGWEVRVLDNLRTGSLGNLQRVTHHWIYGCITDSALVKTAVRGVDVVFHLAALVGVEESSRHLDLTREINVKGLRTVLDASLESGASRFIFASSASVYGNNAPCPQHENLRPDPASPYAESKLLGERILEAIPQSSELKAAAVRFFNVFGPGQNSTGPYAAAIPAFIKHALRSENIILTGDGGQTRDFLFVEDLACLLAKLATMAEPPALVNAGYGNEVPILSVARTIVEMATSTSSIEFKPARHNEIQRSAACIRRLRVLPWEPLYGLAEGLYKTCRSYGIRETIRKT
jgi:UDP-glucose 4-epimerase